MDDTAITDDLLVRVRKRDRQALGELYDRYAPSLRGMTLRILTQRDTADRAVQEAFLHLWEAVAPVSSRAIPNALAGAASRAVLDGMPLDGPQGTSAAAWLTLQARSSALARLRAARTADAGEFELNGQLVAWLPRTGEVELVDRRRDLLLKIFHQLPKPQRELLEKLVFEGWRETEIAEKQGEPLAKVKSDVRAAMRFLRHRLRAVMGTWGANI
ncbi:MAG TPA: sigma factor-like helix-turn-helix DNA-binding protein [Terriglobia bacterium]|nr:sigma factor-like helix-turn-helix DNA-binding protein [Terriglobia bacterium]